MNDFLQRYKTYKTSDLLLIIENKERYQPLAVDAARKEIENRNISEEDLREAKKQLNSTLQQKERKNEKLHAIGQQIKNFGIVVGNSINPIRPATSSATQLINLITVIFTGLSLYQFYSQFNLVLFLFTDNGSWDVSVFFLIFSLLIVPVATFFFWRRKKAGWFLLAVYLSCAISGTFIINLKMISKILICDFSVLSVFLVYGGSLWVICKEVVREEYNIEVKIMVYTLGITSILSAAITYIMFS